MRRLATGLLAGFALLTAAGAASAADHVVQMKNQGAKGGFMVFEPAYVEAAPGDTVTFEPTDPGHNAVSLEGMTPKGATPWNGALNEKLTVTLTTPGVYGYSCTPHLVMGMVGVVVVGPKPPANLAEAKAAAPAGGKAEETMTALLAKAGG